jgi:E3 ubiquitin-protein ligase RGLG
LFADLTQSNTWTGRETFGGKCLHDLSPHQLNPYEEVISIVGRTLSAFDDDGKIPVYGFGDSETTDKSVRSFGTCDGFHGVLEAYRHFLPTVRLSGPTSFVPLINKAIELVKRNSGYHILVIICDGQVSDPARTGQAIVEASKYALSIIAIGVGDGPWDAMEEFDDELPQRQFDNFQFVPFHSLIKTLDPRHRDATFALQALQELPDQYRAIQRLKLL